MRAFLLLLLASTAWMSGAAEPLELRRPSPVAQQPIVVPPPVIDVPRQAWPVPPAVQPPPAIQRPPVLTSCDVGGCWDSDGRRLNRSGPVLVGPGGACMTGGNVVQCP